MRQKATILAIAVAGLLLVGGILLTALVPPEPRVTVSFLGFTNALPFLGAPGKVRSPGAAFQVTNHTALRMAYDVEAQGFQPSGKRSSATHAGAELPAHGTGTFMVYTSAGTNGWKFEVVGSISRPRPAWQHLVGKIAKEVGLPPIFVGPARTYPHFTNLWTSPL